MTVKERERVQWLAVTSLFGVVAVLLNFGENYMWIDDRWSPGMAPAIPFAAALPVVAVYLAIKLLKRGVNRWYVWFFLVLSALNIALTLFLAYEFADFLG